MNQITEKNKHGGKRTGSGRKPGVQSEFTKERQETERDTLKMYRDRVSKIAGKLLEAQTVEALGFHKMVRIEVAKNKKTKELYTVTNPEEFDSLLENGILGVDYLLVAAASPNYKASESIFNRAFGRPKETIEHQGADGEPLRIILDL